MCLFFRIEFNRNFSWYLCELVGRNFRTHQLPFKPIFGLNLYLLTWNVFSFNQSIFLYYLLFLSNPLPQAVSLTFYYVVMSSEIEQKMFIWLTNRPFIYDYYPLLENCSNILLFFFIIIRIIFIVIWLSQAIHLYFISFAI